MPGPDAATVRAAVRATGWELDDLQEVRPRQDRVWWRGLRTWWQRRQRRSRRVRVADLWESLVTLLAVGMPLDAAVAHLAEAPARPRAERRMLAAVAVAVRQGRTLAEACTDHPGWFDPVDAAMLRAGQHSGQVPAALQALAADHHQAAGSQHRLIVAMTYPAILLVAALGVVAFISSTTLPRLLAMLREARVAEPVLSVVVMHLGTFLVEWGVVLVPVLIAVGILSGRTLRRVDPTSAIGRWWCGTPIARALMRARVAEVAGTLSRLQASGVPLTEALSVTAQAAGDPDLARVLDEAAAAVRRGDRLSASLATSSLLEPDFAQLLRLGEQSGDLAAVLARLAERYRAEARRSGERLAAVLEPVAVVIMAVLIGTVVMAAVLPLVALGNLL